MMRGGWTNQRVVISACMVLLAYGMFDVRADERASSRPARQERHAKATEFEPTRSVVYKRIGDVELKMFIFEPEDHAPREKRPAIVFFFGGGWMSGSPTQFYPQATYLASRGMVAMAAEYRVYSRNQARIVDCIEDARSAIRWARTNAEKLGIDPDRIVAAGGSAGGHLAACTATIRAFDRKGEDGKIPAEPNAIILFNPAVSLHPEHFGKRGSESRAGEFLKRAGAPAEEISPLDHIDARTPPALILHGTADTTVPYPQVKAFAKIMKKADRPCKLVGYDGQPHGFFNYRNEQNFVKTMKEVDAFLIGLKYLRGEDHVDTFVADHR